jgi:hypothetical protein
MRRLSLFFLLIVTVWSLSPRFKQTLRQVYSTLAIPHDFHPEIYSQTHRSNISHSIFTVAIGNYSKLYVKDYFGTLRKIGYIGDVVLAITPQINQEFIDSVMRYDPVLYKFRSCHEKVQGTSTKTETVCSFLKNGETQYISVNMVRYLFYQWWWASKVMKVKVFHQVLLFSSLPFSSLSFLL